MDHIEKISLAVLALSNRVKHLEERLSSATDQEAAAKIAAEVGIDLTHATNRSAYHPGDDAHRSLARVLVAHGWPRRRVQHLFDVSELTLRRWLK